MGARRWAGSEVWGHLGRELKQVISEGLLEQDGGGESLPLGCSRSVLFCFVFEPSDSPQLSSLEPIGWACAVGLGWTGAGVGKGHS